MAVSKRLRYEILRRDNHACRYCGQMAPDVPLTVDHVVPVALGGGDAPENLVAACRDCNSGKTSMSPDAPLVADVQADALRWSRAIEIVTNAQLKDREARDAYVYEFDTAWTHWGYSVTEALPLPTEHDRQAWVLIVGEEVASKTKLEGVDAAGYAIVSAGGTVKWAKYIQDNEAHIVARMNEYADGKIVGVRTQRFPGRPSQKVRRLLPRPSGWESSIWQFYAQGLPLEDLLDAVIVACGKDSVSTDSKFRYMCGVCWRRLEQIREAAVDVVGTLDDPWGTDGT